MLCWNVRGLNTAARCITVHGLLAATYHIACLQETKLNNIDGHLAAFLGGYRLDSFAYKSSERTRGGILLLWNSNYVHMQNITIRRFSISALVTLQDSSVSFLATAVYGPTRDVLKQLFLRELRHCAPDEGMQWLLLGDFNLIYRARDKNELEFKSQSYAPVSSNYNFCKLNEVHLQNRKYTWSNERRRPTMCKLDRVFCNEEWDLAFDQHGLQALSTSLSDHCPLLLSSLSGPRLPRPFRFENFWTKIPGFKEEVQAVWKRSTAHTQPLQILYQKMAATARHLRAWSRSIISENKLKMQMALEVIHMLDIAQETRQLSSAEFKLRQGLKRRVMGYAVIERARKKQASRVRNLREGDANTKYFHLKANGRRRKNHIQRLQNGAGWSIKHEDKAELVQSHFTYTMGPPGPRDLDFYWPALSLQSSDLSHLDTPFTEEEVLAAINNIPPDKAPGPDGYTGAFFRACWTTVKGDLMTAMHTIYSLRTRDLDLLNTANIVLLPKKSGAQKVTDYRRISLIHSVAKIFAKLLASRLAPAMKDIISKSQSAFIKGRIIHDNFLYVCSMAQHFHRNRVPMLMVKLDIAKAFDSVRWDYLLSLLSHLGFPVRWRNWIAALFATSSSQVLLNGIPGQPICHGRGLRQGDPLSPSSSSWQLILYSAYFN